MTNSVVYDAAGIDGALGAGGEQGENMHRLSLRSDVANSLSIVAGLLALALLMPVSALGHSGHVHEPEARDGRLPSLGDFKRVGDTTYRYLPKRGEYEISRPGRPRAFLHADPSRETSIAGAQGASFLLPGGELSPICRTSRNRIVAVVTYLPGQLKNRTAEIREIIRRMNWKIADQSSRSSEGARIVRMVVDCDQAGEIAVRYLEVPNSEQGVILQAPQTAYGEPTGINAVKYLIFHQAGLEGVGGYAERATESNASRSSNSAATVTHSAVTTEPVWFRHTTIHELFHNLGAVNDSAPFAALGHCDDGLSLMCYDQGLFTKYTETRCPGSQYGTSVLVPIDCGNDAYFGAAPTPGTWLAKNWNLGHWQNPFLLAKPAVTVNPAIDVYGNTGTLNSTVHPEGVDTKYRFEWASAAEFQTSGYTHTSGNTSLGWGVGPVAATRKLEGLEPETTYHFRTVAESEAGTTSGEGQFTTLKAPLVTTGEAQISGGTSATLDGAVNPNGLEASYHFEYDTKPYGSEEKGHGTAVPAAPKAIGTGEAAVPVAEAVQDLATATTYYYRVVATSAGGAQYLGEGRSFTTPDGQAPRFKAEAAPARLVAEQTVPKGFRLEFGGIPAKCQTIAFPVTRIYQEGSRDVYLDAQPSECELSGSSATIDMKSCHYVLHAQDVGPPYGGAFHVECINPGDGIEVKTSTCAILVHEQDGDGGVAFATEGSAATRRVKATMATGGLAYEVVNDDVGCPLPGKGSFSDGAVVGELAVKGESYASQPVGVFMEGFGGNGSGYFLAGSESESEELQPRFNGETPSLWVSGRQLPLEAIEFGAGSWMLRCNNFQLDGAQSGAAVSKVNLSPRYEECKFAGLNGTVFPTSCSYELAVSNSGPPYSGTLDILCDQPSDAIEIKTATCRVRIPAQKGIGGIGFGSREAGSDRRVTLSANATGIAYEIVQDGIGCPLGGTGAFTNGTLNGPMLLEARKRYEVEMFLTGKQSGVESEQPRIDAEYFPVDAVGAVPAASLLTVKLGMTIECGPGQFDLADELANPSASLQFKDPQGSCGTIAIDMNSCQYVLDVENSGPPYVGNLEVECAQPEDMIEFTRPYSTSSCVVGLLPQELADVELSNQGVGPGRHIAIEAEGAEVSYQVLKYRLGCPTPSQGVWHNGTLQGSLELLGRA